MNKKILDIFNKGKNNELFDHIKISIANPPSY